MQTLKKARQNWKHHSLLRFGFWPPMSKSGKKRLNWLRTSACQRFFLSYTFCFFQTEFIDIKKVCAVDLPTVEIGEHPDLYNNGLRLDYIFQNSRCFTSIASAAP